MSQTPTRADVLLAEANTNFGPARRGEAEPVVPVVPQPTPAPAPVPVAPPVVKTPPPTITNPEAAQMAQDETLRRQADQVRARTLIDEGSKLYFDGKYDLAIVKLEEAVKLLPRAKATEIDYSRATNALGDSYQQLADRAYRANDNAKALDFAKKALQHDPSNRAAENLIVKLKQAEREAKIAASRKPTPLESPSPAKDPKFQADQDQIRRFFREGKILLSSGQFDEAEKRFQQILLIDPYNEDAQEFIRMVSVARGPSTLAGQEAARTRALWQVDDAWLPPVSGEVRLPDASSGGNKLPGSTTAMAAVQQKLNEIKFPQIRFRDASLVDVVSYLSEESRKLDPKGEGVNIVLGPGIAATPAPAPSAVEGDAAAPAAGGERRITLDLKNVPMVEALRYITSLSNLKFRIESSAVLILPIDSPDQSMITRFYPVTAGSFTKFITGQVGAGGGAAGAVGEVRELGSGPSATVGTVDVKELFTSAGVPFPAGANIVYNERTSTIIIHNTPENIEAFERALPSFDVVPKQIEIETRFIDISQGDLDELGFNWKVGQKNVGEFGIEAGNPNTIFGTGSPNPANFDDVTGGLRDSSSLGGSAIAAAISGAAGVGGFNSLATIKGILTDPQFELVIKALSQKKTADVLSAPKVTTINGVQAQIKIVQEFIYPSEYTEPQVSGGNSAAITPSVPSAFKTREIGVVLNVTPTVGSDNYTINLALTPEVSEFLGFLDYSPGNVTQTSTTGGSNTTTSVPFKIQQPLFSTRTLATSVVIWDGQTVVLGGLIKENIQKVDDKVPFLGDIPIVGRLFRSKATTRSKQNLLIFVTARLVDPAGNPIHKTQGRANR